VDKTDVILAAKLPTSGFFIEKKQQMLKNNLRTKGTKYTLTS
jgi:hypothetical protein